MFTLTAWRVWAEGGVCGRLFLALLVKRTLRRQGWRVLRLWEHELAWATRKRAIPHPAKKRYLIRLSATFSPSDAEKDHWGGEAEARLVKRLRRLLE